VWETGCGDPTTYTAHSGGNDWGIAGCNDGRSAHKWIAARSAFIWGSMLDAIGGDRSRIVCIIPGYANSWYGDKVLGDLADAALNPRGLEADALAINSYFGNSIKNKVDGLASMSIDQIYTHVKQAVEDDISSRAESNKAVADKYGVKLFTYEGGQHLVASDDATLTEKYIAVNRDPRMKGLYARLFEIWSENGGDLFAVFSAIGTPSKWGSWGILEGNDQPRSEAPKYDAVMEAQEKYAPATAACRPRGSAATGNAALSRVRLLPPLDRHPAGGETFDLAGRAVRPGGPPGQWRRAPSGIRIVRSTHTGRDRIR
jgi:hypothetical protein